MVIANMALQLETPSFIMPKLLQMVTNQSQADASLAGLNLLRAQTLLLPCNCLRANHAYIRNSGSDHMSVTIKLDRVDDRLWRLLGVGSLSSSSASHTCSLLGS